MVKVIQKTLLQLQQVFVLHPPKCVSMTYDVDLNEFTEQFFSKIFWYLKRDTVQLWTLLAGQSDARYSMGQPLLACRLWVGDKDKPQGSCDASSPSGEVLGWRPVMGGDRGVLVAILML